MMHPDLFELFRGIFGALMKGGLINDQEFARAHQVLEEHDPLAEQRATEAAHAKQAQDWAEYQRLAEQFGQQAQPPQQQAPQAAPQAPPAASGQFPQSFPQADRQQPPMPPQGPPAPPPVPAAGGGFHQESAHGE
jgi:hypothetical protein